MFRIIAKIVVKFGKWKVDPFPDIKKAIVIMAPHTSILDFVYGKLYFFLIKKKTAIIIKKEFFKWPLGPILKKLGGVPVDRKKTISTTRQVIDYLNKKDEFYLIITPEGTRKKTKNWKKGFIKIAKTANVPVVIGYIDCKDKIWGVKGILNMTGTDDEIMEKVKKQYVGVKGVNPENFETGYE